jgi:hypothetical protein
VGPDLPHPIVLLAHGSPQRVSYQTDREVPEHIRNEIRVECDIAPRHLTICECRPPRRGDSGPDWTRFPIGRLHYTRTTGLWTLYWPDHNLKYHRYQPLDPSPRIQDLLDSRADSIFWG